MNARDPLTFVYPRTLRETRRDPYEWWSTAEAAVAEEEHIRKMFAEPPSRARIDWSEVAIYAIAFCVAVWFALAYFTGAST